MTAVRARLDSERSDNVVLALVVWLCLLPVLLLVTLPVLGWRWALGVAAVALLACFAACARGLLRGAGGSGR